jgi:hypothetical protein
MRATLEQLKAMDKQELFKHWGDGKFPFERIPGCHCMTGHHSGYTDCKEHVGLVAEVTALETFFDVHGLLSHLEELYALRLFYDHLYPQEVVVEAPPSVPEAVAESVVKCPQ